MLGAAVQKLGRGLALPPASRDFVRCCKGATAVEFALVATPFIALLVAILQTVLVFFAQRVLDEVTEEASRYIMTGQAQTGSITQSGFANYLCTSANTSSLVGALFTCSNIMINVQNYPSCAVTRRRRP
jgi:Flp pilus assembly protein TadG